MTESWLLVDYLLTTEEFLKNFSVEVSITDHRQESYQRSTRKARKVFQRLGRPSPSSVSTGITPGYRVSSGHRPSPSRFDATSSIASATRSSGLTTALRRYSSPRSTS